MHRSEPDEDESDLRVSEVAVLDDKVVRRRLHDVFCAYCAFGTGIQDHALTRHAHAARARITP